MPRSQPKLMACFNARNRANQGEPMAPFELHADRLMSDVRTNCDVSMMSWRGRHAEEKTASNSNATSQGTLPP